MGVDVSRTTKGITNVTMVSKVLMISGVIVATMLFEFIVSII
jgi:hypothetical protein